MNITLAFDVYGTLIDTHNHVSKLREIVGNNAEKFSHTWRDKQLEYSFRRGLMKKYKTFAICTSNALEYTCVHYDSPFTKRQKNELLKAYSALPAFKDVKKNLARLKEARFHIYAFSNGCTDAIETLLIAADIREYFIDIVSVDDIKSFKPAPEVYRYFLKKSGATSINTWLISSNPFDVIGAISVGIKAAWIQRSQEIVFDPWEIEPTITVESISDLRNHILNYKANEYG